MLWNAKQASHSTISREKPTIICSDILKVGSPIPAFSLKASIGSEGGRGVQQKKTKKQQQQHKR
jgi:hypothetical protein